jgi:general secretion pathway protein J
MNRNRGFTLIEVLIAMAIVAVIGIMALTGLNTVISQQEIAEQRAERWREIQLAMRIIVQDLSQVHPRATRDETGVSTRPSFLVDESLQFPLEFSRGGWSNPTGLPRGSVLRVAYDLEEDTLVRFYWPVADRTLATPPGRMNLLTGVVSMRVLLVDSSNEQFTEWPPTNMGATVRNSARPRAVEIQLELEDLGEIYRLIEVSS